MLTSGKLDNRVGILAPNITRGAMGEQVVTYVNIATVWAGVTFQKGINALTVGEGWMINTVAVSMRDNSIVNERCRLVIDGRVYSIESFNRSKKEGSIAIVATTLDEEV